MAVPGPLEYESQVEDQASSRASKADRQGPIPRGAHGIASVACLVVFWGNVATYAMEEIVPGHAGYDELRILWSVIAVLGIIYGRLATRATDYRRTVGLIALVLNALLLVAMWAWRLGLFYLFAFHT